MNIPDWESGCSRSTAYGDRPAHEWTPWEDYAEGGITLITVGPRLGKMINFWEDRQKRTCQKCGMRDDRLVRQEVR